MVIEAGAAAAVVVDMRVTRTSLASSVLIQRRWLCKGVAGQSERWGCVRKVRHARKLQRASRRPRVPSSRPSPSAQNWSKKTPCSTTSV